MVVDGLLRALIVLVVAVAARGAVHAIMRALHETSRVRWCGAVRVRVRVRVRARRDVSSTSRDSIHPRRRVIRSRATGFVRTHGQPHARTHGNLVHARTRIYDVLHERTHDEPRGDAEGDDDQGAKGDQRARDACGDARWAI